MCGRKTLFSSSQTIKKQFNIDKWEHEKEYNPSFNIAPTLESQVIVFKKQTTIKQMRWGFGFGKSYKPLFNARIETLNKKNVMAPIIIPIMENLFRSIPNIY